MDAILCAPLSYILGSYSADWPAARAQSRSRSCGKRIVESVKTEDILSWGEIFVSQSFCPSWLVTDAFPSRHG